MAERVRITQIDGPLPNLALMRIAAVHRARGDNIFFTRRVRRDMLEPSYDRVYGSAIFSYSARHVALLEDEFPGAIIGGTWNHVEMKMRRETPVNVEDILPAGDAADYSIFPDFDASLGMTQRGCRMKCGFCVVPWKEGKPRPASTIAQIWRGEPWPKHIHLLDNDFFGSPDWRDRIKELRDGKFKVCFNQGINTRLLNAEAAEALASVNYRDDGFKTKRLYTAWDNVGDEGVFFRGVETLERRRTLPLGGYNEPVAERTLSEFARWVIRKAYTFIPFHLYDVNAKGRSIEQPELALSTPEAERG